MVDALTAEDVVNWLESMRGTIRDEVLGQLQENVTDKAIGGAEFQEIVSSRRLHELAALSGREVLLTSKSWKSDMASKAPAASIKASGGDAKAIAPKDRSSEMVVQCFQVLDANGDGLISREELAMMLRRFDPHAWGDVAINHLFKSIDVSSDGKIDYVEFTNWAFYDRGSTASEIMVRLLGGTRRTRRARCKYGAGCYNKKRRHLERFCHPGDSDYEDELGDDWFRTTLRTDPGVEGPAREIGVDDAPLSEADWWMGDGSDSVYPSYWRNRPLDALGRSFDAMYEVDVEHHAKFDELLRAAYIGKSTQDRPCPTGTCAKTKGGCPCNQLYTEDTLPEGVPGLPVEYRVRGVIRVEDSRMWIRYAKVRDRIRTNRKDEVVDRFDPVLVSNSVVGKYPEIFLPLDEAHNEAYLFHGTNMHAAHAIADSDFRIDLAGSAKGTMYGRGVYMAESCTKSDEYAKADSIDDPGVFAMLLCRVCMGKFYYTDKRDEHAEFRVEEGTYDSTLGSRLFRELVAYDNDQIYPEYILLYHRRYLRDHAAKFERALKKPLKFCKRHTCR